MLLAQYHQRDDGMTRLLIARGALVNAAHPRTGDTALHAAAGAGRPTLLATLMDLGANPHVVNGAGEFPLDNGVYGFVLGRYEAADDVSVWQRFVKASTTALASDNARHSALYRTMTYLFQESGRTSKERRGRARRLFKELLDAGANPNTPHDAFRLVTSSPLWEALACVDLSFRNLAEWALEQLLSHGANPNPTQGDGYLHALLNRDGPHHPAVRQALRTLIRAGADPQRRNRNGETVLQALERRKLSNIVAEIHAQSLAASLPVAPATTRLRM